MNQPCKNPLCDCKHLAPVNSLGADRITYWCPRCGTLTNPVYENGCLIPLDIERQIPEDSEIRGALDEAAEEFLEGMTDPKSAAGTFSDTE